MARRKNQARFGRIPAAGLERRGILFEISQIGNCYRSRFVAGVEAMDIPVEIVVSSTGG
jgi:hypothetical protein